MTSQTYVINFISGPGSGKSTFSALLYAKLKLRGYVVEYIQEFAKTLVWTKDFETLNNQYYVSNRQYKLLKQMVGSVQFIVTDAPLVHGLYYNRHNVHNSSNIEKTERFILEHYHEFNNINIFLERGNFPYEQQGRIETEEESKEIDIIMKHLLRQNKIPYVSFHSDSDVVDKIVDFVVGQINTSTHEQVSSPCTNSE